LSKEPTPIPIVGTHKDIEGRRVNQYLPKLSNFP